MKSVIDMRPVVSRIEATVSSHRLDAPGAYQRWLWQNQANDRKLGLNEYGCADAANILYTIGRFPSASGEREAFANTLQELQNPATGMFSEVTHQPIHCTAHCVAALELFDVRPRHLLHGLSQLKSREALCAFLEKLNWAEHPWPHSHLGAGLYAALVLAGEVDSEWQDWYFEWFWNEADPETGLWRKNCIPAASGELFPHLAGSFHYLFNHEYARRPLRYPDRMVETCLKIIAADDKHLSRGAEFADIDWAYCLNRSLRQCGHRYAECRDALHVFATRYCAMLSAIDCAKDENWNDLHKLFGATCALAELQSALPGLICTEKPLRLVLDRRPFI